MQKNFFFHVSKTFSLLALMSFSNNKSRHLIILSLIFILSLILCYYFLSISNSKSSQKFFSLIYHRCYTSTQSTSYITFQFHRTQSSFQQITSIIRIYFLNTCDQFDYTISKDLVFRLLSLIHLLLSFVLLWQIRKLIQCSK